ncbi:MAG: ligase-associated DNA damage response exonuclease [Euryhalocaulis sp.]|uniref:ligase-associated DNA damage response exonuclease n=1 Tax=Euryhalocaulis sp. TaxID=2744307 RepID=UPI00183FC321|nr:ligase-associated DNA damage response exonuclease [Euryhalocaulis sp.]
MQPAELLRPVTEGLCCPPGGFFVDPVRPVERAVITHGHADHARAGHKHVLATPETLAIMAVRYGENFAESVQPLPYGETVTVDGVKVKLVPAGHVLGSAQAVVEKGGLRMVVSGDYKRRRDPTCPEFEPVPCDVFITEATFALPVFRHPDTAGEVDKLLASVRRFPERAHVVGVYALGKAQRVIRHIREAGYDQPLYIHGALRKLCDLYEEHGIDLGPLEPATVERGKKGDFAGAIILGPPSAFTDKWARRFPDPVAAFCSGWMRIRARARQRGVELPLIISDHADWDELTDTIREVAPGELWITHGREDALALWAQTQGIPAKALSLVGYEDEND